MRASLSSTSRSFKCNEGARFAAGSRAQEKQALRRQILLLIVVTVLLMVLGSGLFAKAATPYPLEPLDTSSPRATLQSLIDSSKEASSAYLKGNRKEARVSARRAMECLDLEQELPDLREALGLESMLYLMEVLHRIDLPPMETIPDKEGVQKEKISSWTIPHTPITIGIGTEGSSKGKFLFTPETIKLLPELYKIVKDLPFKWGGERADIYRDLTSHGGLVFSRRIIFMDGSGVVPEKQQRDYILSLNASFPQGYKSVSMADARSRQRHAPPLSRAEECPQPPRAPQAVVPGGPLPKARSSQSPSRPGLQTSERQASISARSFAASGDLISSKMGTAALARVIASAI